jgi:hypothetical protein
MAVIGVRPVTMTAKSAVFAVKGEVMKDTHFFALHQSVASFSMT